VLGDKGERERARERERERERKREKEREKRKQINKFWKRVFFFSKFRAVQ